MGNSINRDSKYRDSTVFNHQILFEKNLYVSMHFFIWCKCLLNRYFVHAIDIFHCNCLFFSLICFVSYAKLASSAGLYQDFVVKHLCLCFIHQDCF